MLDSIKYNLDESPNGNFNKAQKEIVEALIRNECTLESFKYIVENIIDLIVQKNTINLKVE